MATATMRSCWQAAAVLFFCNLLVGLWFLNEGIFHYDSVILAQAVEKTYQTGVLQPSVAGRYGSVIFASIVYFPFYWMGQNADLAVRLSSLLSHALSIVALFFLVRELFSDRRHAFMAGLLLSFVPCYFSPNTYGKEHGMSMLFLICAFWALHRGLRRHSLGLISASSLLYAYSVSVRESILVMYPIFLVLYLSPSVRFRPFGISIPADRREFRIILAWALPLLLALGLMFKLYLWRVFTIMVLPMHSATVNFLGFFSPMFKITFYYLVISVPGVLFFFVLGGIVRMLQKAQSAQLIFLLAWAASIFYFGNTTSCPVRYLDQFMAPVCVLAAASLSGFYDKLRLAVSVMLALIITGMLVFMYPLLTFRHHYNGTKQFAIFVGQVTPPEAVILTADDFPFIEYYGHRRILFVPLDGKTGMDDFIRRVNQYLDQGVPVYFTEADYRYLYPYYQVMVDRGLHFEQVGSHLTENYHNPDLLFTFREQPLYKVTRQGG